MKHIGDFLLAFEIGGLLLFLFTNPTIIGVHVYVGFCLGVAIFQAFLWNRYGQAGMKHKFWCAGRQECGEKETSPQKEAPKK
jgi:hypothetical protein